MIKIELNNADITKLKDICNQIEELVNKLGKDSDIEIKLDGRSSIKISSDNEDPPAIPKRPDRIPFEPTSVYYYGVGVPHRDHPFRKD
jgi:hypothetical protein